MKKMSRREEVGWGNVLPQRRMSKNCFGFSSEDKGQKRLPTPPAKITKWVFLSDIYINNV